MHYLCPQVLRSIMWEESDSNSISRICWELRIFSFFIWLILHTCVRAQAHMHTHTVNPEQIFFSRFFSGEFWHVPKKRRTREKMCLSASWHHNFQFPLEILRASRDYFNQTFEIEEDMSFLLIFKGVSAISNSFPASDSTSPMWSAINRKMCHKISHFFEKQNLYLVIPSFSTISLYNILLFCCRWLLCWNLGQFWWLWCSVCWCVWEHWQMPTPQNLRTLVKMPHLKNWPSTTLPWDTTSIWLPGRGMYTQTHKTNRMKLCKLLKAPTKHYLFV